VIGTLAIFALIWQREWLLGKARRLRDTTLKQATVHVVCHGFVLCGAAWHAVLKTLHRHATFSVTRLLAHAHAHARARLV
jgi:hypothetical protein